MGTSNASLWQRFLGFLLPLQFILIVLSHGLPSALKKKLSNPPNASLLSPMAWWNSIFSVGFPHLLMLGDQIHSPVKKELVKQASGLTLEIGAGSGQNVKYFTSPAITKIYGVEPYAGMHGEIRKAIVAAGLQDKYEILPFGIQDSVALAKYGVEPASVDTIVCFQCICSIPNPQNLVKDIYKLLKPGGKLLVFEHVRNADPLAQKLQDGWDTVCWPVLFVGCQLGRDTGKWLKEAGAWKSIDLKGMEDETAAHLFPHLIGTMVKA